MNTGWKMTLTKPQEGESRGKVNNEPISKALISGPGKDEGGSDAL